MIREHLNIDSYVALGQPLRREFDAWLEAEGIMEQQVVGIRFEEGYCDIKCRTGHDVMGATFEWRRVYPRTPPPEGVLRWVNGR